MFTLDDLLKEYQKYRSTHNILPTKLIIGSISFSGLTVNVELFGDIEQKTISYIKKKLRLPNLDVVINDNDGEKNIIWFE